MQESSSGRRAAGASRRSAECGRSQACSGCAGSARFKRGESRRVALSLSTMNRLLALLLFFVAYLGRAADRPNIVWIVGEDMGPELGCYRDANAITPNMDRLAREGTRFTKAFTHCPVCAPCRSGLITGRYPISIG